ncbi:hypothetical protein DFP73DRAFT_587791 [Morchella snyderi]|nr:hypothetical protein DFP73DRAFT_587791 [Morchella snyderi]
MFRNSYSPMLVSHSSRRFPPSNANDYIYVADTSSWIQHIPQYHIQIATTPRIPLTMSSQVQEGTASFSLSGANGLTNYENHAVVSLSTETTWSIKAYKSSDDSPPRFMIIMECDGSEERCLALDVNAGDNENNVMIESPEIPMPKTSQLWTFEDVGVMERLPPIMNARIQSVARPWLSAAIGGNAALPRLYQNIAGVPNEPASRSQKWKVDYMSTTDN